MKSLLVKYFILLILCYLATGCAKPTVDEVRILWPVPPAQPRMEHIGNYQAEADMPKDESRLQTWLRDVTGNNNEDKALINPHGIHAKAGRVFISDPALDNIMVFDFEKATIEPLINDPFPIKLERPLGLVMNSVGNFVVVDARLRSIITIDAKGKLIESTTDTERLKRPVDIAINNENGWIYVSDSVTDQIIVYDQGGTYLFAIGGSGTDPGQFRMPHGVAFDSKNHLYVADSLNSRIQIFDQNGKFLKIFGGQKETAHTLSRPIDIAFDQDDNLFILDEGNLSILTYSNEGELLLITSSQHQSKGRLGLAKPASVFIDVQNRLYITDKRNKRLIVWQILNEDYLANAPITAEDISKLKSYLAKAKESQNKQ
ncbi:MAG: hypothetical protein C0615_00030 [Desulfuromonas sp.]|nr:MAG: hypothetical protein C0615_00030 [Desulfuromonas sp.]